jgi:Flp pilus assembly protein TadG
MTTIRKRGRSLARPRRGQALVETALVLPIFFLVVFGLFDLGRIAFLKAQLENAVREGARVGQVAQPYSETLVQDRVRAQAGLANATVAAPCGGGCPYGATLTVTATLPAEVLIAGLVPGLPSPNLIASVSVRIQ